MSVVYYLVTDLWFDPVAGQRDKTAGRMVAIRHINPATGEPHGSKNGTTLRGLASQRYRHADIDFMAHAKERRDGMETGEVVGIGFGHAIRKRPKVSGPRNL